MAAAKTVRVPSPKIKEPTVAKVKMGTTPKPKAGKIVTPKLQSSSAGLKNYLANSKANLFS